MADDKKVLTVEVSTESFTAFTEKFDQYTKALKATNELWEKQLGIVEDTKKSVRLFGKITDNLAKGSRKFLDNILRATLSMFSWKKVLDSFKGLAGFGSLPFGLTNLASGVSDTRRTSSGIGANYGNMQSFTLNFQRLVDSQALMANVARAKFDQTSSARVTMIGLGLNRPDVYQKDTGDISAQVVQRAGDLLRAEYARNPGNVLAYAQGRGFTELFSEADIIRLATEDPKISAFIRQEYEAHKKDLELTKDQQNAWTKLNVTLGISSAIITTKFEKAMTSLAVDATGLSDAFTKLVSDFLESDTFKVIIEGLHEGLDWLDKQLGDKAFQEDVKRFMDSIPSFFSSVGTIITEIIKWGKWLSGSSDSGNIDNSNAASDYPAYNGKNTGAIDDVVVGGGTSGGDTPPAPSGRVPGTSGTATAAGGSPGGTPVVSAKKPGEVLNWFMKTFGMTREQALGPVGWMGFETGNFTEMHQRGRPDSVGDLGFPQWSGPRRTAMEAWVAKNMPGTRSDSEEASKAYLEWDLVTNHPNLLRSLRQQKTYAQTGYIWGKDYEGVPSAYPSHKVIMDNYANQFGPDPTPNAGAVQSVAPNPSAPTGLTPKGSSPLIDVLGQKTSANDLSTFQGAGRQYSLNVYSKTGSNLNDAAAALAG